MEGKTLTDSLPGVHLECGRYHKHLQARATNPVPGGEGLSPGHAGSLFTNQNVGPGAGPLPVRLDVASVTLPRRLRRARGPFAHPNVFTVN